MSTYKTIQTKTNTKTVKYKNTHTKIQKHINTKQNKT